MDSLPGWDEESVSPTEPDDICEKCKRPDVDHNLRDFLEHIVELEPERAREAADNILRKLVS